MEAFSRSQGIDLWVDMIDYKWVTGRPTAQLAFITRPLTLETGVRFPVGSLVFNRLQPFQNMDSRDLFLLILFL